ncbi:hypothetical protein MUN76_15275 [Leucobacter rhizosphaerae]|uniref:Uncharacterized protein n=1 Tax=Leucobacter rhizosphaerae TaxID=2932245 RepID=A0ABY4FVR5_9MICO|nr:hypothetical protein [Leucobacter rhizosphaerae]UOQ60370.1 hypothetical protein MUN76_15275 [Leucobacter rhizosphaerae]
MSDRTDQARRAVEDFETAKWRGREPNPWALVKWVKRLAGDLDATEAKNKEG